MERLKCNLTFRELRKDENLYDYLNQFVKNKKPSIK